MQFFQIFFVAIFCHMTLKAWDCQKSSKKELIELIFAHLSPSNMLSASAILWVLGKNLVNRMDHSIQPAVRKGNWVKSLPSPAITGGCCYWERRVFCLISPSFLQCTILSALWEDYEDIQQAFRVRKAGKCILHHFGPRSFFGGSSLRSDFRILKKKWCAKPRTESRILSKSSFMGESCWSAVEKLVV